MGLISATSMDTLGLDIGGANLKAAHSRGGARVQPFALWKDPSGLTDALRSLLQGWTPFAQLAVTMTGELCDCFETKRQGVSAILDAVTAAAKPMPVKVWRNDGRFVDVATARTTALQIAAANWLALAVLAGRHAPVGPALLLDIGSTTTDIVPLRDGKPVPRGRTDPERLRSNELVYTGVRRTPLCALLGTGGAAELFATTLDVFLVLGRIAEDSTDTATADGRPATRAAAHARLARMLCADVETSTEDERRKLAERVLLRLVYDLTFAVKQVAGQLPCPPQTVVIAGSGEFLAELVLREQKAFPPCRVVSLARTLGPAVSQAACAHAVATLATGEGSDA
jgi:probable H4MPT-linked C1 transfer pathway protein